MRDHRTREFPAVTSFPPLPENRQATLATLHAYAHAVAALPRVHAVPHPKWWNIWPEIRPDGVATEAMTLPAVGPAYIRMDPRTHEVVFETSTGERRAFPMNAGMTATETGTPHWRPGQSSVSKASTTGASSKTTANGPTTKTTRRPYSAPSLPQRG